jgi:hypothetical protein
MGCSRFAIENTVAIHTVANPSVKVINAMRK